MSHIAESIRRNHKVIILGMALGLIALYMLPLDQIFAASNPISRVTTAFENAKNRISLNTHIPGTDTSGVKGHILNQLNTAEYHVISVLESHGF